MKTIKYIIFLKQLWFINSWSEWMIFTWITYFLMKITHMGTLKETVNLSFVSFILCNWQGEANIVYKQLGFYVVTILHSLSAVWCEMQFYCVLWKHVSSTRKAVTLELNVYILNQYKRGKQYSWYPLCFVSGLIHTKYILLTLPELRTLVKIP